MKENLQLEVDTIIQNSAGEVNSHQSSDLTRLIERKVLEAQLSKLNTMRDKAIEQAGNHSGQISARLLDVFRGEIIDLTAQLNQLEEDE